MAGLVACKTCGKEIAKGVKKCVHCGKDQRNWFRRHKIMSALGAIIVVSIIGSALSGGGDGATTTNGSSKVEVEKKEKIFKVGDIVKDDQLEIKVSKVEEKHSVGDQYYGKKASEGGVLVAIQYTMKNVSDEPVGVFDYPTLNLVDEKGTKYDSDIDASSSYAVETKIDDSKILSDLNPGITVTGTEVYEISKDAFAKGKWYIQIGSQKVQVK
ncbi:DUF4352 domain-containing protein [Gottfriedia acidiceleris]|uniref:DUF4352 domain-containing protein n=1 Tax=Gottfriedia acidiceleris TaxID=371036 RepID=A0ABY4JRM9_9BACI|nr:DUF4352 domain-containing protein [Gottfriedia acidiceleris]UPM55503.1 DUF4352 domain-containing protein [Gottfriedia acidiceleris]